MKGGGGRDGFILGMRLRRQLKGCLQNPSNIARLSKFRNKRIKFHLEPHFSDFWYNCFNWGGLNSIIQMCFFKQNIQLHNNSINAKKSRDSICRTIRTKSTLDQIRTFPHLTCPKTSNLIKCFQESNFTIRLSTFSNVHLAQWLYIRYCSLFPDKTLAFLVAPLLQACPLVLWTTYPSSRSPRLVLMFCWHICATDWPYRCWLK